MFSRLDTEQFQSCFMDWTREVARLAQVEVVAIDGKTVRPAPTTAPGDGSYPPGECVSFGQHHDTWTKSRPRRSPMRSPPFPGLLELLALRGCIVTIDAMGCQREVAGADCGSRG